MKAEWQSLAKCKRDDHPSRWLSSNIDHINYAKDVCRSCQVRIECLYSAIYDKEEFVGVNGGMSEIEYLLRTWEPVEDDEETNWRKSDRLIQDLFREIA